jgi:transposase-like protein
MKRHGRAETIVTDGLKSYPVAMRELGNADRQTFKLRRSAALAEWQSLAA